MGCGMQRRGGSGAVAPGARVRPPAAPSPPERSRCLLLQLLLALSPFCTVPPSVLPAARAGPRQARRFTGIHIIIVHTLGSTCLPR